MKHTWLFICFSVLASPAFSSGATWQIDPGHSSFQFKVRHLTVSSVRGEFGKLIRGVVYFDDKDVTSTRAEVSLDAASVNTNHAARDQHLRGPDFFDVARFPTIVFVSKQVTKAGPDSLKATGDLTMHGVTREVLMEIQGPTSEVKDPGGKFRRGLTASTKINRKDFGMIWNRTLDSGGLLVGDDVEVSVEIEMMRE